MATNRQRPDEWEEYTYDGSRFFNGVPIAIPIATALWAILLYAAWWIVRLAGMVWRLFYA